MTPAARQLRELQLAPTGQKEIEMFAVACNFNGDFYSTHRTLAAAEKAAEKTKRNLRSPNCGSLGGYVTVVELPARFTSIVDADNEFGCNDTGVKRWVSYAA